MRIQITLLSDADENPTPHRFLDLPNELQSCVAEMYMEELNTLYSLTQPLLARANRHLRNLTLPLFYSTQRFGIEYVDDSTGQTS